MSDPNAKETNRLMALSLQGEISVVGKGREGKGEGRGNYCCTLDWIGLDWVGLDWIRCMEVR